MGYKNENVLIVLDEIDKLSEIERFINKSSDLVYVTSKTAVLERIIDEEYSGVVFYQDYKSLLSCDFTHVSKVIIFSDDSDTVQKYVPAISLFCSAPIVLVTSDTLAGTPFYKLLGVDEVIYTSETFEPISKAN